MSFWDKIEVGATIGVMLVGESRVLTYQFLGYDSTTNCIAVNDNSAMIDSIFPINNIARVNLTNGSFLRNNPIISDEEREALIDRVIRECGVGYNEDYVNIRKNIPAGATDEDSIRTAVFSLIFK